MCVRGRNNLETVRTTTVSYNFTISQHVTPVQQLWTEMMSWDRLKLNQMPMDKHIIHIHMQNKSYKYIKHHTQLARAMTYSSSRARNIKLLGLDWRIGGKWRLPTATEKWEDMGLWKMAGNHPFLVLWKHEKNPVPSTPFAKFCVPLLKFTSCWTLFHLPGKDANLHEVFFEP